MIHVNLDRRSSLDRIRDVGKTVAHGLSSLRDQLASGFAADQDDDEPVASMSAVTEEQENVDKSSMGDLRTRLAASEERERQLRGTVRALRAERDAQMRAAARANAALTSVQSTQPDPAVTERLRNEVERLRGDVARLRTDGVALQRALEAARSRANDSLREVAEVTRAKSALERVCMKLRARVAAAEKEARRAAEVDDAVAARDRARAELVDVKAACDEQTARAEDAELKRDEALHQLAEAKKTAESMRKKASSDEESKAELRRVRRELREAKRTVEEQDDRIKRLTRLLADTSSSGSRSKTTTTTTSSRRSGTANSKRSRGRSGLSIEDDSLFDARLRVEMHNEVTQGSEGSLLTRLDDDEDDDDEDGGRSRRSGGYSRGSALPEASPLLRAVERAHAQLQAAFQVSDQQAAEIQRRFPRGNV